MGYPIEQGSTAAKDDIIFLLVLSSDHITGATGKSPTVLIKPVGASFDTPTGAVSEIANGFYKIAANAADNAALGPLLLHVTEASSDPVDDLFSVVAFDPTAIGPVDLTSDYDDAKTASQPGDAMDLVTDFNQLRLTTDTPPGFVVP